MPGPGPGAAEAFGKFQMCEVPASEDEKNGTKQHSIYGLRAFTRANFPSKTAHLRSSALRLRPRVGCFRGPVAGQTTVEYGAAAARAAAAVGAAKGPGGLFNSHDKAQL